MTLAESADVLAEPLAGRLPIAARGPDHDGTAAVIERRDHGDADVERLRSAIPIDADRPGQLVDELVDRLHPAAVNDDDITVLAITAD